MLPPLNWADVLNEKLDYAVLQKENRLQVVVRPTPQQLRRRGKRNWSLVAAIKAAEASDGQTAVPEELREVVLRGLSDLTSAGQGAPGKGKKKQKKAKRRV